jgi:PAS domain S-box-containing protein
VYERGEITADSDGDVREVKRLHTEIILDSIADGVFTVDRNWNITLFNRAAVKITGVAKDQALGQKCFDVFRADICQTACALKRTIESGREIIDLPVNILNSEGRRIPIRISTSVLRDSRGNIIGGVETFRDVSTVEMLRKEIRNQYMYGDIVSKNHEIRKIFDILPDIATSESTVLIEGPSGSGKGLFARAIHDLSPRSRKKFVTVNCGALPDTLLESELFGYVKGAFTDAKKDKPGRFAIAEGGTIFLDEIGDVSTALQVKLLRVLQEKEYEPLGATATEKANVRIIAATNRTLFDLVGRGIFREDLYYRLKVISLVLPPLSRRKEDIPLLIDHFIRRFNASQGKEIERVSDSALDVLMRYTYPGNIRELENIIEHAFVLCHGREIKIEHLPADILNRTRYAHGQDESKDEKPFDDAEKSVIVHTLKIHEGNRRKTAEELGIDPSTLWRKMKKYGISYPD